MLPDRVSTYDSGALPIALRGLAHSTGDLDEKRNRITMSIWTLQTSYSLIPCKSVR